jgi:hypothetical protein
MKVRLVRPLLVEIAQLDTEASRYDADFQEPALGSPGPDGVGSRTRAETPLVRVPAQVEAGPFERLQQSMGGNLPDTRLVLVFDYDDLVRLALIDPATNETTLRPGDRLVQILNGAGTVLEIFPDPPGMFLTELRPGYGLERYRNILLAFVNDREQGITRGM